MAGRFSIEGTFRMRDRMTRGIRRIEGRMNRFTRSAGQGFRSLRSLARRFRRGIQLVGAAVGTMAAGAALALREVIDVGRQFEQTMVSAGARFSEPATRGTAAFEALEGAAMRTGRMTEFSASQSAEAIGAMAMAGFDAEQAVAALPGVVDLATASQMELGDATSVAADALGQWGLMTTDAAQLGTNLARVNDVLARASTSANLRVEDLSEGFRDAAPMAQTAGVSFEAVTAMLDTLAGAGIRGAQAGTAVRGMLQRLTSPTRQARAQLRRFGIDLVDGNGNLRNTTDIFEELQGALSGLGTAEAARAMTTIFGARAQAAAGVLAANTEQTRAFQASLEGAGGAAAEMAATIRDTATGDLNSMNSAIEGLKLEVWDLVRGPFREVVQSVTAWVRANQAAIAGGVGDFMDFLRENKSTVRDFAIVVGVMVAAVAAAFLAFGATVMAGFLAIPVILAAIGTGIMTAWRAVSGFVQGVLDSIRGFVTGVVEFLRGVFIVASLLVARFVGPMVAAFRGAVAAIRSFFAPLNAFFAAIWTRVAGAARAAWSSLLSGASPVAQAIQDLFRPVGEFFAALWDGIASSFRRSLGWVVDNLGNIVGAMRSIGRGDVEVSDDGSGGFDVGRPGSGPPPQVVTPSERVARSVSESTSTERAEVTVRADRGTSAEVTRRPRGRTGVRLQPSGAF